MSTEFADAALAQVRDTIARLQTPVPDLSTLLSLLAAPLAGLGLLPPRFRKHNVSPISPEALNIARHIPPLQRALLEHVAPTWEPILLQENAYELVEQYFCPDAMSFAIPAAGQLALYAYSTILSLPINDYSVRLLAKLCKAYPIDVLHGIVFAGGGSSGRHSVSWEDCVRNVVAVPAKVANYMADRRETPFELEQGRYFDDASIRTENLVYKCSSKSSPEKFSTIAFLIAKLANLGVFPQTTLIPPTQPSFFRGTLPIIRKRLGSDDGNYAACWSGVLSSLPSSQSFRSVLTSLLSSLRTLPDPLDRDARARALVLREAQLLQCLLGPLSKDNGELLDCLSAVVLGRNWDISQARAFAYWASGAKNESRNREGLDRLLSMVVDMWTDPDHIRHSLLSRHQYLTSLFLLTVTYFPPPSPAHELALSPPFVKSISTYISHIDHSVRRCGMLVAEEVARAAGKTLDFGGWEGDDPCRIWARRLRELLEQCDADADEVPEKEEVRSTPPTIQGGIEEIPEEAQLPTKTSVALPTSGYDSDDSLTGYASPTSSRSASPTPSELAEIEKDPTLRVGAKKVPRPVYLAQLGEMVRPTSGMQGGDEQIAATKMEVALEVAEELIRRKSGYGTELEENAVNLAYGLVGLQDNYDLEGFDQKRQAALNALVACCPRKVAPTIIEQFFTNQYSSQQRFAMLNALALGAQELASLPVPELSDRKPLSAENIAFPSKRLPPALHNKYLTLADELNTNDPVPMLLDGITRLAIGKEQSAAESSAGIVRERALRIRSPPKVTELVPNASASTRSALAQQLPARHPKRTTFTDVAAEVFVGPLVNRFWRFLRDEQTREARTAHQPELHRYRGAGTGLVLNPLALARMLETLAVLMYAARNAREWLAVLAPDALELALTLGTRPVSREEVEQPEDGGPGSGGKEAAVLTASLELALVVLDGCVDLDGGRSLGLEHTALLLGTGEWAGKVFNSLEEGARVAGGGGAQELRLRRAAASVILKVDEASAKWRRSMVDFV